MIVKSKTSSSWGDRLGAQWNNSNQHVAPVQLGYLGYTLFLSFLQKEMIGLRNKLFVVQDIVS